MNRFYAAIVMCGCASQVPEPAEPATDPAPAFHAAMAKLEPQANACVADRTFDNYFPVAVTVAPDGSVTAVGKPKAFSGELDPDILGCITTLLRAQRLDTTVNGYTLTYPFELHGRS
jgi:hypothetical protein